MKLKLCLFPFDWVFTNYKMIIDILNNNFENLTDKSYISNKKHSLYHQYFFLHKPFLTNKGYYKRCITRFNNIISSTYRKLFVHTVFSYVSNHPVLEVDLHLLKQDHDFLGVL
jgi:hypothetical protein